MSHALSIPSRPGEIRWDAKKSLAWFTVVGGALILAPLTFSPGWAALAAVATWAGVGAHVVGLHRGLIHRSYRCPLWLERVLVAVAVLNAIGGPRSLRRAHDLRDHWQRRAQSPEYYSYDHGMLVDFWWYLHCRYVPEGGDPELPPRPDIDEDWFYAGLDRWRLGIQLASLGVAFLVGGLPGLVWLGLVRLAITKTLFWLANDVAHTHGAVEVPCEHRGETGRNVLGLGLLSFGEAWHNNHHAFPDAANTGLRWYQVDPGYWVIRALGWVGLAWDIRVARAG
jgi:stearoyl-CoA desaturase (delta-9 desaturase)